jgi:hypothetical protein
MTTLTATAARSLKAFCIGVSAHILTKWLIFILALAQASKGIMEGCIYIVNGVVILGLAYSVVTGLLARWDARIVWWWIVPSLWILGLFAYTFVVDLSRMLS